MPAISSETASAFRPATTCQGKEQGKDVERRNAVGTDDTTPYHDAVDRADGQQEEHGHQRYGQEIEWDAVAAVTKIARRQHPTFHQQVLDRRCASTREGYTKWKYDRDGWAYDQYCFWVGEAGEEGATHWWKRKR
jgi:hypothetical protein